ncbi:MAG TPA: type II secretion system minor pseudopilin GspK [Geobacteraceae bacterium]|nr:type II secretion system minor pseudopilin GspK [Geobacteraceae bacterium]
MKNQRGFALVITLIITALLVALTAEFVSEVFVDTSARQSFTDGQKASLLAGSGMEAAIRLLQIGQGLNPGYTSQADLDRLASLLHIEDESGTIQVIAEDESGKLNLNLAWGENGAAIPPYSDVARRLVKNSGLSLDLLDALADWRDSNDEPHPGGAEKSYYSGLKPPYEAKNGKLSTVEELRLVKGFDAAAFGRLRPLVTVYDACSQININTAPKEVIAALADDMTANLAAEVVDYRKTHPFNSVNDLMNVPGMSGKTVVQGLQGFISVKGSAYRIHSEAKVNETIRIVEAVVDGGGQPLYWREY